MVYLCSKCHKTITEPMVSKCDNRYWHSSCLTCQMCGHRPSMVGEQSMYMFRGSLICKNDYMRINCVCKTCSRPLSQSDMVIKADGYGYMHDKCVFCGRCQHRLETGDHFMLTTDQMIVCQKCIMQQHPQGPPTTHLSQPTSVHSQAQMVQPSPMGPMAMSHHHSNSNMNSNQHHSHPQQYGNMRHNQQQIPGTNNHTSGSLQHRHQHGPPSQQQYGHQSAVIVQSSANYAPMVNAHHASNGYGNAANNSMNGIPYHHHMLSTGPNGPNILGQAANGLSRATPPSTPNQTISTTGNSNANSTNTNTTANTGRRGRKRNTQIKEEF